MFELGTEGHGGFGLAEAGREEHPRRQGEHGHRLRGGMLGADLGLPKAPHTHMSPGLSWAVPRWAAYLML